MPHRMGLGLAWLFVSLTPAAPTFATVTDTGQIVVTPDGRLEIGLDAPGSRTVDGELVGAYSSIALGLNVGGAGELNLLNGSSLAAAGKLSAGALGSSVIRVLTGSVLETGSASIVDAANSNSIGYPGPFSDLSVIGVGSRWVNQGFLDFNAGNNLAVASLLISEGGNFQTNGVTVSGIRVAGARTDIVVSGSGSSWKNQGSFALYGDATFTIRNGATAVNASTSFGDNYRSARALVEGAGSSWTTGDLRIGTAGYVIPDGFVIRDGGFVHSTSVTMTTQTAQLARVTGPGSKWLVDGELNVLGNGAGGNSSISIENGGQLVSQSAVISGGLGYESITVSGVDSTFRVGNLAVQGYGAPYGSAAIFVEDGARLHTADAVVTGCQMTDSNRSWCGVSVAGTDSEWVADGSVSVSGTGTGVANIDVTNGAHADIRDGLTIRANSSLNLDHGVVSTRRVDLEEGALRGSGGIDGDVSNNGRVAPGNTASGSIGGVLIHGAYFQSAAGTLDIQLGGTTPALGHDVLAVIGTSFLAGTLHVELTNGYLPNVGDSFDILASASVSGQFDSYQGLQLSPNLSLRVDYLSFGVRLTAIPEPGTGILLCLGLAGVASLRPQNSAAGHPRE